MSLEFWIALIAATGIAFFIGRKSASKRAEIDALNTRIDNLRAELETSREQADVTLAEARDKAAAVEDGVTSHFEQSAVLFGKLAQDYRAFFEHFSTSAQQLGVSEGVARQLLAQLDEPLISEAPEADANIEVGAATPGSPPDAAATPGTKPPTLDPISAKVAEIELEEAKPDPPRKAG